jgi:hypothetical protein
MFLRLKTRAEKIGSRSPRFQTKISIHSHSENQNAIHCQQIPETNAISCFKIENHRSRPVVIPGFRPHPAPDPWAQTPRIPTHAKSRKSATLKILMLSYRPSRNKSLSPLTI